MGTLALATIAFLLLASSGSRSSAEPTPAPTPNNGGGGGGNGGGEAEDPTIGPDGYPQIVFYEDGSWDEPTFEWFDYAGNGMEPMLPPPGSSAPEMEMGEFDFSYVIAWEFLADEVPDDIPYPDEPYAPDGTMWQTSYPGVNYFAGPDAVLGLIEHLAAYIDAALPAFNESGELILIPEGSF